MVFLREIDVERRLEIEEREIVSRCGARRRFKMMRVFWEAGDFTVARDGSWERLAERALAIHRSYGTDADDALAYVVNTHHRWLREKLIGLSLDVEPGPSPLIRKPWESRTS
ncbi:MAG: hypothetical protein AAF714_00435 [Pseudomonadota bacterium]